MPIFNGSRYLRQFFESLAVAVPEGSEIILVDDASTEPVFEFLPDCSVLNDATRLRNDVNLGYSGAVNRAFECSTGEISIQLNTDLILHPNCVTALLEKIRSEKNPGILGSKLTFPTTGRVQHAGMAFGRYSRRHIFFDLPPDHPLCNETRRMQIITGATVAMTNSVLQTIGPLDERYYNHNEDLDHCLKAEAAGFHNFYVHNSEALHWTSQSGPARFSQWEESDALFWSTWSRGYRTDLDEVLRLGLRHVLTKAPKLADRQLTILNMCKSLDETLLIDEISEIWPKADERIRNHRPHNATQSNLWLAMTLPHWLADEPEPFVYIVDTASELAENWHWFRNRRVRVGEEIIIDLSGAAYLTSEFETQTWSKP